MAYETVSVDQFKEHFDRGQFTYGDDIPQVRDKDITAAIREMSSIINTGLYPDEDASLLAQKYLTAHFLTNDLTAAQSGGQAVFSQTSRSVGSISESVAIPDWMMQGQLAPYATTYYGQKWLMLTKPYLIGRVSCVAGGTTP